MVRSLLIISLTPSQMMHKHIVTVCNFIEDFLYTKISDPSIMLIILDLWI